MNWLRLVVLGFALQAVLAVSAAARNEYAQGNLTVTAVVESSVGVITDGQGNPKIVVADAAGPGDNVSELKTIPVQGITVAESPKKTTKKRKRT